MLGAGKNTVEIIIAAKDRTQAAFAKVNTQMKGLQGGAGRLGGAMNTLKGSLGNITGAAGKLVGALGPLGLAAAAAAAAVAVVSLGVAAVKSFAEFEDAMANVRKTTGFTKDEIKVLGDAINEMALTIPVAQTELADIAAIAGQLGIQGKDNILSFTKDVAKMSTAFDMSAESAATAMAKMSNIYDIPIEQASALGSAINVLGNTTAAQESAIMNFSMSLGASANQLGFSATEAVSMGASLISMGMDASDSGTRLNAAFTQMGKKVGEVAAFLGLTEKEFKAAFGADPMAMMTNIIGKLSQIQDPLERNTAAAELFGAIGAKAINGLGGNLEGLQTNLANAAEGFEANTSLSEEFAAKTDTLNAKFKLFGNAMDSSKIKIGEALAPLAGVLVEGAMNAVNGLSAAFDMLLTVIGPAFDLITIKFQVLKAFLEGLFTPIIAALAPLKETLDALQQKFAETSGSMSLLNDIFTIITGAAKWLGEAIGTLVAMALTPLVAKLQEGIAMLGAFYDKLGPIKGALEWVGEGVHNVAESFRDTKPPIEEVATTLETLAKEGPEAPKAIADAWALATKSFQEGSGTYKEAIDGINEKIAKLTEEYMTATDKRKVAIEKEVELLRGEGDALEELKKTAEDALSGAEESTEKATEKMKEFKVTIGDTTIEFKGAAAEVVKNADAYEKLQDSAQKIMDLDWSVFTEFEASLPSIETGIQDMEGAFVGLKDILEDNIGSLENVQEAVMDISEIAAPFLEAGFVKSVETIGNFAGALQNAGSAINTFGNLTEANIEGCINFSSSVYSMVSALGVLETQMHDMKPAFADMEAGMRGTLEAFVYPGGVTADIEARITEPYRLYEGILKKYGLTGDWAREAMVKKYGENWSYLYRGMGGFDLQEYALESIGVPGGDLAIFSKARTDFDRAMLDIKGTTRPFGIPFLSMEYDIPNMLSAIGGDIDTFAHDVVHSSSAIEIAVNKQVVSLNYWSEQLTKITDALEPYLSFMRTLNELTALSTLSIDDINAGFEAITDTLSNLSRVLKTVDFAPVMKSLFGEFISAEEGFAGGAATGFVSLMQKYSPKLKELTTYTESLSGAISSLVTSFDALTGLEKSVLTDTDALTKVFSDVNDVITILSDKLSSEGGNFAAILTTAFGDLLDAADPLMIWFRKNSVQVTEFNAALSGILLTFTHLIDVFEDLGDIVKRSSELVVISAKDIETALSLVDDQLIETVKYLESPAWGEIVTQLSAVSKEWVKWAVDVDNSMPAFTGAVDTFSTLISKILGLSSALKDMRDMSVLSVRDIDEALKNIPVFLDRFVDALALNMYEIKRTLKELDIEWSLHTEEMKATIPAYEDSTDKISKLISPILSLSSALKQLAEMGTISSTTFDKGFASLMSTISNFAVSLGRNVDGLISSLQTLRQVWIDNEDVLYPLIYDFAIISDNLFGVAHNANRMAEEFKNISENAGTLEKGFKSLIEFIETVVELTKEFYTTEAAAELAMYIEDVGKVITSFVNLERELKGVMDKIQSAIGSAVDYIAGKISSLGTLTTVMYHAGANLMQSLINGIWSKSFALATAVAYQAMIIKAYLGAASNTEKGALAHLESWGPNIVRTLSEGIRSEMPTLNAAFGSMSSSMGAGTARGRGGNITLYNTQYINSREDGDYATRSLERMLQRHEVM